MGKYTSQLAKKIRKSDSQEQGTGVIRCADYVSPAAIRIGGHLFSHNIMRNPGCTANPGDTVLVAQIGVCFYIICKVV